MIKKDAQLINIIVRAILVEDGKVVVVKWQKPDHTPPAEAGLLIGGRVEYGEELTEALVREVKEETGVDVKIEKLLYTHQQIYVSRRTGTENQ
ncbi:MAG: NUDIX domain-containing protein, partial [Chloroflexota bacterium]